MTDRQRDKHKDIATYRLNRPKGRFSEKIGTRTDYANRILDFKIFLEFHAFVVLIFGRPRSDSNNSSYCGGSSASIASSDSSDICDSIKTISAVSPIMETEQQNKKTAKTEHFSQQIRAKPYFSFTASHTQLKSLNKTSGCQRV